MKKRLDNDIDLSVSSGWTPVRDTFLPFALPCIGKEEIDEVVNVLESGWLTTGPRAAEFEKRFGEYVGARFSIAVDSCTAALHLALIGLGIGDGGEVITTPYTFAASANAIIMSGAKPVFVDIDPTTRNIDVTAIEAAITENTRAILPVHIGGFAADMEMLQQVAQCHRLHVVEDAAHSAGARYGDVKIGTLSDATCFSFYATKTITTGEGGMLCTDREDLASKVRSLSLHGLSHDAWNRYGEKGTWYYEIVNLGYKYNISDIHAALGMHQVRRIDEFTERRRSIAAAYDDAFRDYEEVSLPPQRNKKTENIYHLYPIGIDFDGLTINRDAFMRGLRQNNIGASVHFIPLHMHPYYRDQYGFVPDDFPVARRVYENSVSLPIYPSMSDSDVSDVCRAVTGIIEFARL